MNFMYHILKSKYPTKIFKLSEFGSLFLQNRNKMNRRLGNNADLGWIIEGAIIMAYDIAYLINNNKSIMKVFIGFNFIVVIY